MDYETFDNDAPGTTDAEYFAFAEWLTERTAKELRQAEGDRAKWKDVLCRFWKRGYRANLPPGELIDFLSVNESCAIERAELSEDDTEELMEILATLSPEEINQVALD